MMYVLIDSTGDVVDKIDSITPGGAEHYFMKRKLVMLPLLLNDAIS